MTLREFAASCIATAVAIVCIWLGLITAENCTDVMLGNLALGAYCYWLHKHKLVIVDTVTDKPYLTRWHLIKCKWFRVFLHRIHRADKDRHLHNHPWPKAFALILWGRYTEMIRGRGSWGRWTTHRIGKLSKDAFSVGAYHRIVWVRPNTWTLFFAGRRSRVWGFLVPNEDMTPYWERYVLGMREGKFTDKSWPTPIDDKYYHVPWTLYLDVSEDTDLGD